ncbi:hypothetical protein AQUCO_06100039v1 [Aquilegia coerulea]|uniref:Nucleoplasmin-like domain-containing protein n=1 Tax=Aquilegia coerulea TaxID=218851 RepID=A0A2G5CDA5_AQUCA|nr:hypothetical protein AQUCO_06100039v1 [Aquilegia coerulea]
MEFWGAEVKAGEPLKVKPEEKTLLHVSHAALGEPKKDIGGSESVVLFATINGQKIVIGTLSTNKCPQISYDLVFEKEFELSHNWNNGSVYFFGYRADTEEEDGNPTNIKNPNGLEATIHVFNGLSYQKHLSYDASDKFVNKCI